MKKDTNYNAYKKRFDRLCQLLNINPSVIITYKFTKNNVKDKNSVYVRYETKNKKFDIPKGYALYHISPASNITALEPHFRGKEPRNYFYSTPRVYVTINKDMGKGYAQFKGDQKDVQVTKYRVIGPIGETYIDDRIGNIFSGALYIEGNTPIRVEKVSTVKESYIDTEEELYLDVYEESKLDDFKNKVKEKEIENSVNKEIDSLKEFESKTKEEIDKLKSEWSYKDAIKKVEDIITRIDNVEASATRLPRDKEEATIKKLEAKKDSYNKMIKSLKELDAKKQLNRLNNKYWIDYTKKHNAAFKETEKELRGYNTKRGIAHDMDKYAMYHFLPPPLAHAIHTKLSKHHTNRAKTKEDYLQMMIDWESNRKTKPDKQLKPYQILDKFYPELKNEMIPIMKEYGIPINAEEDNKLQKSGKKYLPNKHNKL